MNGKTVGKTAFGGGSISALSGPRNYQIVSTSGCFHGLFCHSVGKTRSFPFNDLAQAGKTPSALRKQEKVHG